MTVKERLAETLKTIEDPKEKQLAIIKAAIELTNLSFPDGHPVAIIDGYYGEDLQDK